MFVINIGHTWMPYGLFGPGRYREEVAVSVLMEEAELVVLNDTR